MKVFYLKRKLVLPLLFPLMLISAFIANALESSQPLSGKTIIIDAGHGGIDSGANRPGAVEKDINLAISIQLRDVLTSYGANVILSRESDIDLSKKCDNPQVKGRYHRDLAARIELVEESNADIYISIHANASTNPRRKGPESFYYGKSADGKRLANLIQSEFSQIAIAQKTANPGDYFVLRRNQAVAVLIEAGYITNLPERTLLQSADYQQKIAQAIGQGICAYYSGVPTAVNPLWFPTNNTDL